MKDINFFEIELLDLLIFSFLEGITQHTLFKERVTKFITSLNKVQAGNFIYRIIEVTTRF